MSIDKQQLETKISNMEKELAEMKKILATPEPVSTYWQPNEITPDYWHISPQRAILCGSLNPKNDKSPRYRVFKTEAEASKYADYIKAEETLKKAIADANKGWWPDFNNNKQDKFCLYLQHNSPVELYIDSWLYRKEHPSFMYMKSKVIAETIRSQYKDTLITYLSY